MPTKVLEKDVEKHFVKAVKALQGLTFKFRSVTNRGVTDRIACLADGSTWFVELKRPGGPMSQLQEIHRDELQALAQKYALLSTIAEVDEWFNQRDAEMRRLFAFKAQMAAKPKGAR